MSDRPDLTIPEFSKRHKCGSTFTRKLIKSGAIKAYRLGDAPNAPIRIDAQSADDWRNGHMIKGRK